MGSGGMGSVPLVVVVVVVVLAAVALMAPGAAAQGDTPQCAQRLIPCANYLSSTNPPESCCGQLREAVQNELPCLCSLFNNKQLIEAFKINVTQALELPKHCGVTSDTSICKAATNSTTVGAGGPSAPPATAGGKKDAGASSVVRVGVPGLVGLLAFWWSLVA